MCFYLSSDWVTWQSEKVAKILSYGKAIKKIIQYVIENNIFLEDDKEIYVFGLTQMIRALLNIITIIFIGFCLVK